MDREKPSTSQGGRKKKNKSKKSKKSPKCATVSGHKRELVDAKPTEIACSPTKKIKSNNSRMTTPLLANVVPIRLKKIGDSSNYKIDTPVYHIYNCRSCGKIIFTNILSANPTSSCSCAVGISAGPSPSPVQIQTVDEKSDLVDNRESLFDLLKPNCFMPRVYFEYSALMFFGPTPLICASPCEDEKCPDKKLHPAHTHES